MVNAMYTYDTQKLITLRSTRPANDTINALAQTRYRSLGSCRKMAGPKCVRRKPCVAKPNVADSALSLTWLAKKDKTETIFSRWD